MTERLDRFHNEIDMDNMCNLLMLGGFHDQDTIRVRLFQCKMFYKCKIFSGASVKYFQVFGGILKNTLKNIF